MKSLKDLGFLTKEWIMIDFKIRILVMLFSLIMIGCTGYAPQAPYGGYPPNSGNYNPNYQPNYNNQNYNPNYNPNYQPTNSINLGSRDDSDYSRRIATDPNREATLRDARRRGENCEDERSGHECYDLCKKMYRRGEDKEECTELTPDNIEAMYDVWLALKSGRLNNLESIELDPLDWFLNTSIAGFDSLIREYSKSEAEDVLIWIAENDDAAEIIADEDTDFETLEELLSIVDRFDLSSVESPFIKEIDRKTLFEYAINTGNDIAMDYFLDYFFQTHRSCRSNNITSACLTLVCKIGASIDERDREDILDSNIFSDFAESIIDGTINGATSASGQKWIKGTGDDKIDSINDLDNSWANSNWAPADGSKPICGGL